MEFENKELAEWLENIVRHIMETNPKSIALVAQEDGTLTGYYNCGYCKKLEFASHIQMDSIREILDASKIV